MVNPTLFFDITINGEPSGHVSFELFADNFRALSSGEKGLGYRGSRFHRIIPRLRCQGGDFTCPNSTGGKSSRGEKFEDENFILKHTGPGILSMANAGSNTKSSVFHLHYQARVVGWQACGLLSFERGHGCVVAMECFGSRNSKTSKKITIADCGQLIYV